MENKNITIVLIHGLLMNKFAMSKLEKNFKEDGYNVINFKYQTVLFNEKNTLNALNKVISEIDDKIVYLVGHSMGGLVSRMYLDKFKNKNIKKIVTIGTPNNEIKNMRFIENNRLRMLFNVFGNSNLFKDFPKWNPSCGCDFGSIIGSNRFIFDKFLGMNKGQGSNDGIILVEDAIMKEATDEIILNVTHMEMLVSKLVSKQVLYFLENSKFIHE